MSLVVKVYEKHYIENPTFPCILWVPSVLQGLNEANGWVFKEAVVQNLLLPS